MKLLFLKKYRYNSSKQTVRRQSAFIEENSVKNFFNLIHATDSHSIHTPQFPESTTYFEFGR